MRLSRETSNGRTVARREDRATSVAVRFPSIESLQAFLTFAESGHVTRAARQLGISQPALSRRLAQLEERVGAKLFVREGQALRMSEAGKSFVSGARRVVSAAEHAMNGLKQSALAPRGTVRMGGSATTCAYLIPAFLRWFRKSFPEIQVSLDENLSPQLERDVLRGHLDIAMMTTRPASPELTFKKIWSETYFVVASASTSFSGAIDGSVSVQDLIGRPIATFDAPNAIPALARAMARHDAQPNVVVTTENFGTIRNMVERGEAISLIPEVASNNLDWNAAVYALRDLDLERHACVIHLGRDTLSAAPATVLDELLAWIEDHSDRDRPPRF